MAVTRLDHRNLVILPGMPRAGTTTLFAWLAGHPQIFAPWRKEPGYFSQNYAKGESWYCRFFADMKEGQTAIDASTEYFMNALVIDRLVKFDPQLRLILIVRDPAEFVVSLYAQVRRLSATVPFDRFVHGFDYSRGGERLHLDMGPGFIADRIGQYRQTFHRKLVLIDFRLMAADPIAALTAIERFIGLAPHFAASGVVNLRLNRRSDKPLSPIEWMMTREPFLDAVSKIVSPRGMAWIRDRFERRDPADGVPATETVEQRAVAESIFAGDRKAVQQLFAIAPIVLGDGQPFAASGALTPTGSE